MAVAVAPPAPKKSQAIDTVLRRHDDGHFYVDAEVNGQLVHFVVDTGASTVALTKADAERAGISFLPSEFRVIARGASGNVKGEEIRINHIAIDQKEAFDQRGIVVDDGLDVSLLGQSFLSQIGTVLIDGETMTLR
jgi:aspartyl protease family protein